MTERRYLALSPHYWGRGETLRVAIARLRDSGHGAALLSTDELRLFEIQWDPDDLPDDVSASDVEDNFFVDQMGNLYLPDFDAVDLVRKWTFDDARSEDDETEASLDELTLPHDVFADGSLLSDYAVEERQRILDANVERREV